MRWGWLGGVCLWKAPAWRTSSLAHAFARAPKSKAGFAACLNQSGRKPTFSLLVGLFVASNSGERGIYGLRIVKPHVKSALPISV